MKNRKYCSDFKYEDCCDSCHEDEGLGYDMIEEELLDGTEAYVCCSVSIHLEEDRLIKPWR